MTIQRSSCSNSLCPAWFGCLCRHAMQNCMLVGWKSGRLHLTTPIPTRSSGLWTTQPCISALVSESVCPSPSTLGSHGSHRTIIHIDSLIYCQYPQELTLYLLPTHTGNWSPSDIPTGDSFPPYPSSSWQDTNRDSLVTMEDKGLVQEFLNVFINDGANGNKWNPGSVHCG